MIYGPRPTTTGRAPATWAKANPSLGVTVREDYLAAECRRAQVSPAYENTFKRYHLNLWTQQLARWMPLDPWLACAALVVDEAELVGVPCFGGLDLGQTDDFTALVLVFLLPDGRVAVRARYWLPASALKAYPLRPYDVWRRQGHLTVTAGTATDYDVVEEEVRAWCEAYGVRELAYDARFATQLAQHLQGAGVTVIDSPQGFQLNEPLRKLMELVQLGPPRPRGRSDPHVDGVEHGGADGDARGDSPRQGRREGQDRRHGGAGDGAGPGDPARGRGECVCGSRAPRRLIGSVRG